MLKTPTHLVGDGVIDEELISMRVMKKSIYFLAAFAAFSFVSCQKEAEKKVNPVVEPSGTTLRAAVNDGVDTKVSANPVGVFAWQTSDKIAVLDDSGYAYEFTASGTGASSEFTCASSITLGAYAQYPYSASFAGLGDELDFQIPATITYSTDATNMPMLGKISGDVATFKAVGGLLKLIVYGVPADATKLDFAAKNKKISGRFEIADASVDAPVIITAAKGTGDNLITIDFTGKRSDNMVFYIPLPTGTIDGFDLTFNDTDVTSISSSKNLSIARNDIIVAPAINLLSTTTIWKETFTGYAANTQWTSAGSIQTGTGYDAIGNSGITYTTSGDGTKIYTGSMSADGPSGEPEILVNGSLTIDKIPTNNKSNFILTYYSNKGTSTLSVSSSESNVKFGSATNSGKLYTIPITIENPADVNEIDLVFSAGSNSRLDDVKLVYDPKVEVTPTITFAGGLTRTIGAGNLTANITGVTLNNPLDGNGMGVISDVDWLTPTFAGTTLSCTATGYNHDEDPRVGHVTVKATGAANQTFTITQNASVVSKPSITATPGNATFSVTWTGDTKAKSYIGYYGTTALGDPTTGISLNISNEGTAYTATPSVDVTNGTKYYVYVKVNEVADANADKYVASTQWAESNVTPVNPAAGGGSDDFYTLSANSGYGNRSTTAGWSAVNTAVINVTDASASDVNHKRSFTINGKTSAVGVITSPSLSGGIATLSLRYQNTFTETNGASFKIEIKQGGVVVWTQTVTRATMTEDTGYFASFDSINVTGTFQIVITNLSPSNSSSSNKDRVSIYDIQWTGYSGS